MKKKIVALLLTLVMLVGIIPAAVYATNDAKVTLTVTPDKEIAKAGEEVTFTVTMETEETLASMAFLTAFPEGLEYVDGSGAIDADATATLSFDKVDWTEWSKRGGAEKGDNYVNGYGTPAAAAEGAVTICTFKAKLADDAQPGEYAMDLTGLEEFCDIDWNVFDPTEIDVESKPVVVEAEPKVILTVTPEKDTAVIDEEVTFTVTMETEETLASMAFLTAFPEGLEYVDNSGAIDADATATLSFDKIDWTEWSKRGGAEKGDNYVNGYGTPAAAAEGAVTICTFKVVGKALGEFKVDLTGLEEFCDTSWNVFDSSLIKVVSETLTVIDHVCSAEKLTAVEGKDATCDEDGLKAHFLCEECGTKYADEAMSEVIADAIIPALGHEKAAAAVEENRVEATCTEDGSYESVVYCARCSVYEFSRETVAIPATGHTEGEAQIENNADPDCVNPGSYDLVVYCTVCGEELSRETIEVDALGHTAGNPVEENRVEATCTEDGSFDTVVYCSVCGEELSREETAIPATGHDYEAVVTAPTCTDEGYTTYTCACGDTYKDDYVAALGHVAGEAVKENEVIGNCLVDTTYEMATYCAVCGVELNRTYETEAAIGHVYEAEVTAPTCTEAGYTTYTCVCGDSYVADIVDPLGHKADKIVKVDATATREGKIETYCSVCDELLSTEILDKVTGKVVLTVANGSNTILTGIVNSDYSASVSVPKGVTIDTSSITAGLTMTDVASLGISGTKTFEKVIATGVDKNVAFDNYIPTTFTGATVSGLIDGVAYGYEFTAENTNEAFTVYATPDAGVQPAWHALTSHISTASQSADDSYVLVPNPAYIQIGTEKLVFEDGKDSLKLDNISGSTADEVRATVKLLDVEELEDAQIEIFLPAGTVLALSNTVATLEDDATITISGYAESEEVNSIMSQLRACKTSTDIIKTLALFINDVANAINGQDITLNIEFDHIYGEWEVLKEATCTEAGLQAKYCIMCGEAVEEEIPVLGHDYEAVVTDPTCTEDGYTTYTCTVCGDTYEDDVVAALGHDYEAVVTAPTCTEDGYTTYTCKVCGDTYVSDHVEELGHTYEAEVIAPTCTEQGYNLCTCTVCGDSHKTLFVDALGHEAGEAVIENEVAATCTEAGSYDSVVYCTRCGVELTRETIVVDALGHTAGEAVKENEVAATCTTAGSYDSVVYCTVCGVEISREAVEVAPLDHTYEAVVTAPTCTEAGYTTYTCSACGDTYVADEVAATGHTEGKWVADAEKAGTYHKYCTVCGVLLDTTTITGLELSDEYKKTKYVRKAPAFTLTAEVLPEGTEGVDYTIVWTSSNEKVATVDEDGNVTTHHFGTATITATLYDANGNQLDTEACVVDVYYTFCQWLIWFFLLGCAWYFV